MSDLLIESNYKDVDIVCESLDESKEKKWYIEGIFMQADVVNRNRRIYPKTIMEQEINSYINNYVIQERAIGELNHPSSPVVDPDRASHKIVDIVQEGNNFIGKAMILDTTVGKNVQALLSGGVRLGVSSRGLGSVKQLKTGINEVQKDFRLSTIDIVYQPSAPDAFVNGLMEGADFVMSTIEEDVDFAQSLRNDLDHKQKWKLQEEKVKAFEKLLNKITKK